VNVSERVPSSDWEPLTHQGAEIAQVWFKPDSEPLALVFRVSRTRLEADDLAQQPTVEDLLQAAGISNEEADTWQFLEEFHVGMDGTNLEVKRVLPPPPPDESYLTIHLRLKPPTQARTEGEAQELTPEQWQALDATWKTILGLEASIDALRLSMDGLRMEMESGFKKTLNVDEKVHCLQSDVSQWTKAKNRIHYGLPKVREFVHRATWAHAVPERKRLEEVVKNNIEPRIPLSDMDDIRERLGHLQKDRQVLFAQGNAVNHECRGLLAEIQRALSTLQRNAVENQRRKRSAGRNKGKHL
jgi:hypothetical protein